MILRISTRSIGTAHRETDRGGPKTQLGSNGSVLELHARVRGCCRRRHEPDNVQPTSLLVCTLSALRGGTWPGRAPVLLI